MIDVGFWVGVVVLCVFILPLVAMGAQHVWDWIRKPRGRLAAALEDVSHLKRDVEYWCEKYLESKTEPVLGGCGGAGGAGGMVIQATVGQSELEKQQEGLLESVLTAIREAPWEFEQKKTPNGPSTGWVWRGLGIHDMMKDTKRRGRIYVESTGWVKKSPSEYREYAITVPLSDEQKERLVAGLDELRVRRARLAIKNLENSHDGPLQD